MKSKKIIILLIIIIIVLTSITSIIMITLINNKTFFKDTYIGIEGQEIFIPRYSFFKDECCMTAATFYSLRNENELKKEINNYLKEFKYFDDDTTYGYKKGNLFIQRYEVIDYKIYRKIIITY